MFCLRAHVSVLFNNSHASRFSADPKEASNVSIPQSCDLGTFSPFYDSGEGGGRWGGGFSVEKG